MARWVEVPGTRLVIWGEPYDPPIRWEVDNNSRWYSYPDMSDDSVEDVASREVERGAILEPGGLLCLAVSATLTSRRNGGKGA